MSKKKTKNASTSGLSERANNFEVELLTKDMKEYEGDLIYKDDGSDQEDCSDMENSGLQRDKMKGLKTYSRKDDAISGPTATTSSKSDADERFNAVQRKQVPKRTLEKDVSKEENKELEDILKSYDETRKKCKRTDRIDAEDIRQAIKSVKKASKVTSNAMIYHQAYLEWSAISNNWDLGPLRKKISEGLAQDSSDDESDDDPPSNLKVSMEEYKRLRKETKDDHLYPNMMSHPRFAFTDWED